MDLTKPLLTKSEMLKLAGIPSTTFNNWFARGMIPLKELGCVRENLTTYKYSHLTAAYCAALSYHTGKKRGEFIEVLKSLFVVVARDAAGDPGSWLPDFGPEGWPLARPRPRRLVWVLQR